MSQNSKGEQPLATKKGSRIDDIDQWLQDAYDEFQSQEREREEKRKMFMDHFLQKFTLLLEEESQNRPIEGFQVHFAILGIILVIDILAEIL